MSKRTANVRRDPPPNSPLIPQWLIIVVIGVVLAMWVGSTIYSTWNPNWPIPPSVHGGAIAVITGIAGYFTVRGRGNGA